MQQDMRYVYEVYKQKSFSKAAQALFITQPALSIAIGKLEDKIGMPIFDRSTRPISLTTAGRVYLRAIERTRVLEQDLSHQLDDIRELKFPAFSRTVAPCAGEPKGYGGIGIEIKIGGQVVRTGDWIIGDENGLIVVPKEKAVEVANRALAVHENENRTREEIRRGSTLSKVNELCKWEPVK